MTGLSTERDCGSKQQQVHIHTIEGPTKKVYAPAITIYTLLSTSKLVNVNGSPIYSGLQQRTRANGSTPTTPTRAITNTTANTTLTTTAIERTSSATTPSY